MRTGRKFSKINFSKLKNSHACGNKLYKCNESNQSSATRNFFRFLGKGTVWWEFHVTIKRTHWVKKVIFCPRYSWSCIFNENLTYRCTNRPLFPKSGHFLNVCLVRLSVGQSYLIVLYLIILAVFHLTNNWSYLIVD